ncbi:MAG: hypothetical protein LUD15_00285 [Bacteroides sp.]|nr:hypothetical protein [Bacteroides sp.]
MMICDRWSKWNPCTHWGSYSGYDFLSAATIHKLPFGLCPEYVALGVLTLRSHGVPAFSEYTPTWGCSDTEHSWFSILNDDGSFQSSLFDLSSQFGSTLFPTRKMPKIYRHTYARNPATALYLQKSKHVHPSINLFQDDVTDKYILTSDISIPLIKKALPDTYAYIATFGEGTWLPIDYGEIKNNQAHFKKMGRDFLYIVLSYDGIRTEPVSLPFILHKNGEIEYMVPDTSYKQSVEL